MVPGTQTIVFVSTFVNFMNVWVPGTLGIIWYDDTQGG